MSAVTNDVMMKKWLKYIGLAIAGLAVSLVVVGLFLPGEFRIARSVVIQAPAEKIHLLVGDLERWPEWTPWQDADPTIRISRTGKSTGAGAHQAWTGESGSGELTFTSSSPDRGIVYDLSFDEGGFRCKAAVRYQPEGNATRVTWEMYGDVGSDLVGRYFLLMMDQMVGPMFKDGLDKLKQGVEAGA